MYFGGQGFQDNLQRDSRPNSSKIQIVLVSILIFVSLLSPSLQGQELLCTQSPYIKVIASDEQDAEFVCEGGVEALDRDNDRFTDNVRIYRFICSLLPT